MNMKYKKTISCKGMNLQEDLFYSKQRRVLIIID